MKSISRLLYIILCVTLILSFTCLSVDAKVVYPVGDWVYEKINNDTEFEIDSYEGSYDSLSTSSSHNNIPITEIGRLAFSGNTTLKSISINEPITVIRASAFLNCTSLSNVNLNSRITIIGANAFYGCSDLSTINLNNTQISAVNSNVFAFCDSLTEVTLSETVVSINEQAFAYCDSLSKITIPESVITIHENAFYNSPNVVIYCYKDSAAHVFAETNSIEYVLLEPVETYILGDADNDGTITVLDATFVQLVLAQKTEKIDGFDVRADSDKDGVVSVMDATLIQQHVADLLDDTYEIGKSFEY